MFASFVFLCLVFAAGAQQHEQGYNPEVIRGEVWVEMEPMYGDRTDTEYPLSADTAIRRALQQASLWYAGMIYGWSFHYDIGERARGIAEDFDVFEPMGEIIWGDPRLSAFQTETRGTHLHMWTDYRLDEIQQKRMHMWRMGTVRNAQSFGYCPLEGPSPDSGWMDIQNAVLKDAARSAVREILRATERNRPKEATGIISLASFPRIFLDSGQ